MAKKKTEDLFEMDKVEGDVTIADPTIPLEYPPSQSTPTSEEMVIDAEAIANPPRPVHITLYDDPTYTGEIFDGDGKDGLFGEVRAEMAKILSPQKGKRAVPTLISFESSYAHARRWVIIDINNVLLEEAWNCWKRHGYHDDELFLDTIYKITKIEVPRMFRVVATLDLK